MEIKMYGTETCPQCKAAKTYLTAKNVDFEYVNLFENAAAQDMLVSKGFMTIPIIQCNEQYVVGFNVKKLEEVLNNGNA